MTVKALVDQFVSLVHSDTQPIFFTRPAAQAGQAAARHLHSQSRFVGTPPNERLHRVRQGTPNPPQSDPKAEYEKKLAAQVKEWAIGRGLFKNLPANAEIAFSVKGFKNCDDTGCTFKEGEPYVDVKYITESGEAKKLSVPLEKDFIAVAKDAANSISPPEKVFQGNKVELNFSITEH